MDFCVKQLKTDCDELLGRFRETESVRFEVFSRIWREMKFSEIFYGVVTWEKRALSRLALDTACCYFLPPFSFQVRVGGLYLLYSLYHCQTASPPEPIRLALRNWEDTKQFEKDAVDAQHLDAVYILRKLMFCRAFHFTAMPTLLSYKKKRKVEGAVLCPEFMERASRPQELINIELLEELSNVHELYEKLKTSVTDPTSGVGDLSLSLTNKKFVPELRSTVLDFYKWQQRSGVAGGGADSGEGTSSQQEGSNRAGLLAYIKSKAYGQAAEAIKSRRHRQVELDFSSAEAGPAPKSAGSSIRRSLKRKTEGGVHISGDVWKGAAMITRINDLAAPDSSPSENQKPQKRFKWRDA
ncbi:snRNA-activating protein complex subunit 1b [Parambassis ranga]|uniref:snRNA-activating protein complex subunit 1b n=1 Tax=Parambassis ranga TaxID=210632 RepID=A0A6P7HLT6_9TELE|nr:snRNA-activating protein complex subunit 1-like [Parambassis ranga]